MMRSLLLFAAASALISTATGAQSIQHDYHLDNGLRVVLVEDHSTPILTVDIWYNVGSANEVVGRTGFAHLFEHMMFQGSQHAPKGEHTEVVLRDLLSMDEAEIRQLSDAGVLE